MRYIAFTGTQKGMTEKQHSAVFMFFRRTPDFDEVAHGDCIGADAQFHEIASEYDVFVNIFPPTVEKKRAFCNGSAIRTPKPYLQRNHDMVDWCDVLIAAPSTSAERLRSGTWATVRYALKAGKTVIIVNPDGTLA